MKLRWKLQILLLIISLVPVIIIAVLYHSSITDLGNRLALDTQKVLTKTAYSFLQSLVDDYSKILSRDKEALEIVLTVQAQEISRRLASVPPASPNIILSEDLDNGFKPPGGMLLSNRHYQVDPDGKRSPTPVSYQEQSYFLVKGTDRRDVADDMARLSTMPDHYLSLYKMKPEFIFWQYTGLESGLHSGYPAVGGFPPDYDQRRREWYLRAKTNGSLVWGPPVVDALTRRTLLTLSMPVHRQDGSFAGVTAIDVSISDIFKELKLPTQWSTLAKMTSVALLEWGENGEEKLTVLAQISYTNLRQNWQVPVSLEFLESDDPLELAALIKDAKEGRSGVRKLRHEGRESLWAYGAPGPGGAFPVIIVPYDLIITQAIETKDSVLQMTQQSLQLISLFLLGVIALVTLLAVFVSRWVIRPVSQLSEAAIQLSHGHYQTRINIQTGDELQELGDVFNEMGPRLEKAMEELKMRQQQLIQADKMSSLGVLVSGVAHEINNPNSLILLNISQLQRAWIDIAATLEERFQQTGDFQIDGSNYSEMREEPDEMMRDIRDGATRIKGIVDDLKDFARCDDTGFMESVDLNEVTIAALRLVENSSNNATDQFSIQLEENLPQFTGNRQRIEQVVVNLIINASQALERAEQRIFLRTFLSAEKGELVLEVEDEGRGILQKHLSMLADPFFTTRRDIGGTGLGLSISTGIAKEHGGRIEFDSTPEVGTLVRLVLPRR